MAININAKTSGVGGLETTADNSGNINIQSGGSTVMSVTSSGVAVTGSFSQNGAVYSTQPSFRNLIINGDMRIDQRGSASTPITNNYCVDRFKVEENSDGAFTGEQSTDVPTGQGFEYSLKATVTSTDTSLGTTQYSRIFQVIEGQNIPHLMWGTSNAKTITVSFWVKASVSGTYNFSLQNDASNRTYMVEYTIDSSNTWEKKTITITGDTTGVWKTDNDRGIRVFWNLGTGTTYQTTTGWQSGNYLGTASGTNFLATSGATFYITGVQLEVGSTATDFENLPYDVSLARCQRYYEKSYDIGTVPGTLTDNVVGGSGEAVSTTSIESAVYYKVPKRISGNTVTIYAYDGTSGTVSVYDSAGNSGATGATPNKIGEFGYMGVKKTGGTNFTAGAYYWWQWTSSAEL